MLGAFAGDQCHPCNGRGAYFVFVYVVYMLCLCCFYVVFTSFLCCFHVVFVVFVVVFFPSHQVTLIKLVRGMLEALEISSLRKSLGKTQHRHGNRRRVSS